MVCAKLNLMKSQFVLKIVVPGNSKCHSHTSNCVCANHTFYFFTYFLHFFRNSGGKCCICWCHPSEVLLKTKSCSEKSNWSQKFVTHQRKKTPKFKCNESDSCGDLSKFGTFHKKKRFFAFLTFFTEFQCEKII